MSPIQHVKIASMKLTVIIIIKKIVASDKNIFLSWTCPKFERLLYLDPVDYCHPLVTFQRASVP